MARSHISKSPLQKKWDCHSKNPFCRGDLNYGCGSLKPRLLGSNQWSAWGHSTFSGGVAYGIAVWINCRHEKLWDAYREPKSSILAKLLLSCFARVVRRCFLLGNDPVTGKNYDHRKIWIEDQLKHLAANFRIDLLSFAILSNHFHLILRSRPDVVATWDDSEVARRWLMLCPDLRAIETGRWLLEATDPGVR